MSIVARQLHVKSQEMDIHPYSTFMDLTNAFDTMNREELQKVVLKFGTPKPFTYMLPQLYDGMMACLTDSGQRHSQ
ncbi:unnamed protein product [Schistocephalus solidus]|uniref:Reverse transcriptase domain-containing protein n=1 Tax=Schistocephalus solidus TaxID=70667 RepID=A0A183SLB3_SCHSO|nr:unnamed protein product [Schistocephalus solidus]